MSTLQHCCERHRELLRLNAEVLVLVALHKPLAACNLLHDQIAERLGALQPT